ncbi:GIY-YIG nuclease family protein [Solidesulfovibrio magneticus]|uniref:GIY-YIG catalytic domain-containing protein n=1 Tax=Solidesulfovibrio magneticus (strain ATCC 700980 / DSM 13731 / RS-1) TaxID=573370 RepID=C4XJK8_SOLM1|nr:hypothetical protein [Solidesulfovibrio magneticus]BAH76755.1 hypothetical protein DMR_32640 [Solidesulfovibrio magneticus RS-1]
MVNNKFDHILDRLLNPKFLYTRFELIQNRNLIPKNPGIYTWYFKEISTLVPTDDCHVFENKKLLYLGISPRQSPSASMSKQNLQKRIINHCRGNASSSTLRFTLGCLRGLPLWRVGRRTNFGKEGEKSLSDWMNTNALVTWVEYPSPWDIEHRLICETKPPLNISGSFHEFKNTILELRSQAKQHAQSISLAR